MSTKTINEVDIWTSVINPEEQDMSPEEANAILRWSFNEEANRRMEDLATRNGQGVLTEAEREELEAFINVGQVIAILQAKARLSLKRSERNGTD